MSGKSEQPYDDSKADMYAALVVFLSLVAMAVHFISGGRLLNLLGLG